MQRGSFAIIQVLIRKIARFSRTTLAAFALIGVVAMTMFALFGEKVLRFEVEKRLGKALNRPVKVGAVSVNLAARTVELKDLVIPGRPESKRPSLVAPRVRVALSFRSLLTSRILLRGFELDQPQISVQVFPDGSTDLPKVTPTDGSSSREVSVGKLMVSKGDLFLNDQQIPLEIAWSDFAAVLTTDGKDVFKGDLSAGPGPMSFGALPPQDVRVEMSVRFADSALRVERGQVTAANTKLALAGELDLHHEPKGDLQISGPLDLESFDLKIADTGLGLKGIAEAKAVLSVNGSTFALAGTLKGERGSYDSIPVDAFSTGLVWDGSNLRLKDLTLDALGGNAALNIEVPEKAAVRVAGSVERLMAEHCFIGSSTMEPLVWVLEYQDRSHSPFLAGGRIVSPARATFS